MFNKKKIKQLQDAYEALLRENTKIIRKKKELEISFENLKKEYHGQREELYMMRKELANMTIERNVYSHLFNTAELEFEGKLTMTPQIKEKLLNYYGIIDNVKFMTF